MATTFAGALAECLEQIPRGHATTCGAIARALGDVRASQSVARWLADHPSVEGGHRVVRGDGRPILDGSTRRLAREGLRVERGLVDPSYIVTTLRRVPFLDLLRREQQRRAGDVIEREEHGRIEQVVGVDVSYRGDETWTAAVSVDVGNLGIVEIVLVRGRTEFPYVPTYLAHREFSAIEAALRRLKKPPQALLIDGHGRLHPTKFGVACDVGVRLRIPTIGVAKHLLTGNIRTPRSGVTIVEVDRTAYGYAWTPPGRQRPIFVSVGHRFSPEGALDLVRRVTRRSYPEPLRIADRLAKEMKKNEKREKG